MRRRHFVAKLPITGTILMLSFVSSFLCIQRRSMAKQLKRKSGIRPARSVIAPSPLPTTAVPWGPCSSMTLPSI